MRTRWHLTAIVSLVIVVPDVGCRDKLPAEGEARMPWQLMNQLCGDKFDLVLPEVVRENVVEMWITFNREEHEYPLRTAFGKGHVDYWGIYAFTDHGDNRIERAALGVGTCLIEAYGAYQVVTSQFERGAFGRARDPETSFRTIPS